MFIVAEWNCTLTCMTELWKVLNDYHQIISSFLNMWCVISVQIIEITLFWREMILTQSCNHENCNSISTPNQPLDTPLHVQLPLPSQWLTYVNPSTLSVIKGTLSKTDLSSYKHLATDLFNLPKNGSIWFRTVRLSDFSPTDGSAVYRLLQVTKGHRLPAYLHSNSRSGCQGRFVCFEASQVSSQSSQHPFRCYPVVLKREK